MSVGSIKRCHFSLESGTFHLNTGLLTKVEWHTGAVTIAERSPSALPSAFLSSVFTPSIKDGTVTQGLGGMTTRRKALQRNLLVGIPNAVVSRLKQAVMLLMSSNNFSRAFLNTYYCRLSASERSAFHTRYAKIFRKFWFPTQSGTWHIEFLGKELKIPLNADRMWLDWDTAVSVIGHDIEVKQTYEEILRSAERPSLFFDVGANYGTHALLMASQGIKTYAFEPNSTCIAIGQEMLDDNGLAADWQHTAVGSQHGRVCLTYPERNTWNGSVSTRVDDRDNEREGEAKEIVNMQCLDDYVDALGACHLLVKIDVEGFELDVIKGSDRLLGTVKPLIVFESNQESDRSPVYEALRDRKYEIFDLPWSPVWRKACLTGDAFMTHHGTNFLAAPVDRPLASS